MGNEQSGVSWSPCENCLRPLVARFREWSHDDPRIDRLRHPATIEGWYRDCTVDVCRRWLEFHVSPDYADRLQFHLDGPLNRLRDWQKRCDLGAWNDVDDIGDEYESICCDVAAAVEFMNQLAAMIDGKAESAKSRKKTPPTELVVSVEPPQVTLPNGETHVLTPSAAKLLAALVTFKTWVSAGKIVNQPTRVRNAMPQSVRVLIESAPGKGFRLKPPK